MKLSASTLWPLRPRTKASEGADDMFEAKAGMIVLSDKNTLNQEPFLLDLGTDINPESTQSILSQLIAMQRWFESTDKAQHKPVRLICNCNGGDLTGTNAILDQLDSLKQQGACIETYVTGVASSAAAVIASHGSKGHRYIAPRAHIMLHQASLTGDGARKPVQEAHLLAGHGQTLNQSMLETLVANMSGKTSRQTLEANTRYNLFLNARQAIEYGLADHIGVPRVEPFDKNA